jgi:aminotransferase
MSVRASLKAERFTESVIREMTRLANLHGAVNLSQGFPDFAAPEEVKEAARQAVASDINQYAITWGARSLRQAIARKFSRLYGLPVDPEREITVTCGSTEAMIATLLAVLDPGDEVIVAGKISDYTGKFVVHCHMLDHEDHGLMSQFEVQPAAP